MEHFICTGGCGGVSGVPGVCQTEGCANFGKPLKACSCPDGEHAEVKAEDEIKKNAEMEEGSKETNEEEI